MSKSYMFDLSAIKDKYQNERTDLSLDVENNALYCPNPEEWYAKAYIRNNYEDFRVVPRVKAGAKLAENIFPTASVLREFDCDFDAISSSIDSVDLETAPFTVPFEICQRDLEDSFVSMNMNAGNENWKNENNFFSHYWDQMAMKVASDLSRAKWQGQSGTGLATIVGLQSRITNSSDTVDIGTSVTDFTSVDDIEEVFEELAMSLPEALLEEGNIEQLRFYVNPRVLMAIQIAQAKNNNTNYTTTKLGAFYMGIPIKAQGGLDKDMIVVTRTNNLIINVDAVADESNLKIRDLDVINVPKIRTRIDGKLGTQIVNDEEIIYAVEAST